MTVSLTRGHVALVDDADYDRVVTAGSWSARPDGARVYAQRAVWLGDGSTTQQLHHFLTGWSLVDHINGDGLDNRRCNLRAATVAQNNANARLRRDNTSGYKGVSWHKAHGRWHARIRVDGRLYLLGAFMDPIDAALAYDAAARHHFGAFARPNFPAQEMAS